MQRPAQLIDLCIYMASNLDRSHMQEKNENNCITLAHKGWIAPHTQLAHTFVGGCSNTLLLLELTSSCSSPSPEAFRLGSWELGTRFSICRRFKLARSSTLLGLKVSGRTAQVVETRDLKSSSLPFCWGEQL